MDATVYQLSVISLIALFCATIAAMLDYAFFAATFAAEFGFAFLMAIRQSRRPDPRR